MAKTPAKKDEYRTTLLDGQGDDADPQGDAAASTPPPESDGGSEGDVSIDAEDDSVTPEDAESLAAQGSPDDEGSDNGGNEQPTVLDALRQLGWEGENEVEGVQRVAELLQRQHQQYQTLEQRLQEQEELANYGREWLRQENERRAAEEAQQQAQQKGPEHWWAPPQFDPAVLEKWRDVTIGEDGSPKIGWKSSTPREIIASAEAYQEYLDKWATDLVQRPHEVLPRIIETEFDRLFEQRIAQRDSEERLNSFAQAVRETNRDWMFTTDARGREVLTAEGQRMTELLQEAADRGMVDPEYQWDYAVARFDYLNRLSSSNAESTTETAKQTAAKKRKEHLRKAVDSSPNRTGTVSRPESTDDEDQDRTMSPGELLVSRLKKDGVEF